MRGEWKPATRTAPASDGIGTGAAIGPRVVGLLPMPPLRPPGAHRASDPTRRGIQLADSESKGIVVVIFGVLATLASAGIGALLAWDNRQTIVHLDVAGYTWTGHLYAVLVGGALLACWFLLGVSCIRLRFRERRHVSAASPRDAHAESKERDSPRVYVRHARQTMPQAASSNGSSSSRDVGLPP
jgi:hypothetical protein